jgi:hypothetical protein
MERSNRIDALAAWATALMQDQDLEAVCYRASAENLWFSPADCQEAVRNICEDFLNAESLKNWLENYPEPARQKQIALVMAGNLPAVGFHDLLCVLALGHQAQIKLSSKDQRIIPWMLSVLKDIAPELAVRASVVERIKDFDAVIATGSNNSMRYFKQYFGAYPNLLRGSRSSAAVILGDESQEELDELAKDVFTYCGLGCRSVSKLFVPRDYDPNQILASWEPHAPMMDHNKYKNNYDYHRSLYLLNGVDHLASDFLILKEHKRVASAVAVLHYEFYDKGDDLQTKISEQESEIQIVVGRDQHYVDFGKAQRPGLSDYADNRDTMEFLLGLN